MPQSDNIKIALVVIPNSKLLIEKIAEEYYLWVIESPENKIALKSITGELTTFPFNNDYSLHDEIENYLDTVIEHHPDWEEILLAGVQSSKEIEIQLSQFGVSTLSTSELGIHISRSKDNVIDV